MDSVKNAAGFNSAVPACTDRFDDLPEDEQVAALIRLFGLAPVSNTQTGIWITGLTRTDWYARQNPKDPLFDGGFPTPIGGRRSKCASRRYWTVELLRWRIRLAASGNK